MLNELGITDGGANKANLLYKMVKRDFKEALIKTVHNSKAVCLSHSDPDPKKDPLYENLMWSHYADGLRGFCIVLDRQNVLNHFLQKKLSIRPIDVRYQNFPMTLSLNKFAHSRHILNNSTSEMIHEVTQTIGCKSTAWSYEKEFRLLSLEDENLQYYPSTALLEIIIGDKMTEENKKRIIDTAKATNSNVSIKLARLKKDSYELEIIDYKII